MRGGDRAARESSLPHHRLSYTALASGRPGVAGSNSPLGQEPSVTVIDFAAFIEKLATASGETILPFFRTSLGVENKKTGRDFDPVTEADRGAEAAMRRLISTNFPQHGIVGEEFGNERADAEYVWVLDPIDGTKAFIGGFPVWGTLIALLHHGQPAFGMMHQPFIRRALHRRQRRCALSRAGRRAQAERAALRVASRGDALHDDAADVERRPARAVRQRRGEGAAVALWRRLLRLLHARGRPRRSRDRGRAELLRHRSAGADRHAAPAASSPPGTASRPTTAATSSPPAIRACTKRR